MMRKLFVLLMLTSCGYSLFAQVPAVVKTSKGKFYGYWGWNRSVFSKSDIHFKGKDYDFTLLDIKAKDRQSDFSVEEYFGIQHFTIPQYNMRIGYNLSEKWDISLGADHMKYVMIDNQKAVINGTIAIDSGKYNGVYNHQNFNVITDFLTFEHTDGLNYVNAAIRRNLQIIKFKKLSLSGFAGIGLGLLVPKSNVKLMSNDRHDAFHLSGWGVDLAVGLKLSMGKHFFIQSELKEGYINMPDILTTYSKNDKASQHFRYGQSNLVFGYSISFGKNKK